MLLCKPESKLRSASHSHKQNLRHLAIRYSLCSVTYPATYNRRFSSSYKDHLRCCCIKTCKVRLETHVLEFKCDWCGRQKRPRQSWIMGLAAERSGVTGHRRQVEILKEWSTQWVAHPLAVHFCSEEHKDKYIESLFASPWPSAPKRFIAKAAFLRKDRQRNRGKKIDPVVERHIADEAQTSAASQMQTKQTKRRTTQKRRKPSTSVFGEIDQLHARGLGIIL